jgi:predicted nucleic acid-binding protein
MGKVLIDTNFLIHLLSDSDPWHASAQGYFIYFLSTGTEIILSTIVVSEYCVRGNPGDIPYSKIKLQNFTNQDAILAGQFQSNYLAAKSKSFDKDCVNNDVKLLAQAQRLKVDHFISSDSKIPDVYNMIQSQQKYAPHFNIIDHCTTTYQVFSDKFLI